MNPLDRVEARTIEARAFRITLAPRKFAQIDRIRSLTSSAQEVEEALDLLNEDVNFLDKAELKSLIDWAFDPNNFRSSGRFSEGSYGVLYTALEPETSAQEYAHWAPGYFGSRARSEYKIRLQLVSCTFAGTEKDVRAALDEFPWLVTEESPYRRCKAVGAQAVSENLDAIVAPSARKTGGATLPIFRGDAASTPERIGDVWFVIIAESGGGGCTFQLPTPVGA